MRRSRFVKHLFSTSTFLCLVFFGCGEDQEPSQSNPDEAMDMSVQEEDAMACPAPCLDIDAGPPLDVEVPPAEMPQLTEGDTVPASAFEILSNPLSLFDVLLDGRIIGATENGISLFHADGEIAWGDTFGVLRAAHTIAGDDLVFTSQGIYALVDNELQPSPLNELVRGIRRVVRTGATSMWMMADDALYHWADGTLRSLSLDEVNVDWMNAHAAAGQYEGQPALWVAQGQSLLALTTEGAWFFDWPDDIAWIAGTAQGLWVAHQNLLSHRSQGGDWTQYQRPEDATYAVGSPEADDLWVSTGTSLWQWTGEHLSHREGTPSHGRMRLGDNGDAYLSNVTGVFRVSAGRLVRFDGLPAGSRLLGEVTVDIRPSLPNEVDEITVQIDGTDPIALDDAPWRLELSATELGPGSHDITVNIRYIDGQIITGLLSFLGPPTWTTDVAPLSDMYCSACHGDGGSAHPMATAEQWQVEIAAIMDDIETGRMPYGQPRLDDVMIQVVRDWRDSGFLEQ